MMSLGILAKLSRKLTILAMRKSWLLAIGAALLGGLPLLYVVQTDDTGSEDTWQDRFVACAGGDMRESTLVSAPVQTCLYEVMLDAVEKGDVMGMQQELQAQIQLTPDLYAACHTIGHKAGQRAFELSKNIVELLTTNQNGTCQYAIGHGVLDGFALSEPTDAEFQQAADACMSLQGLNEGAEWAFRLCSDGLGHVAWTSTLAYAPAAKRCGMLSIESSQEACAEGVIMQVYEPAGTEPSADPRNAHIELPIICANWAGNEPTRLGCYAGAGYIYTRDAFVLHYNRERLDQHSLVPAQAAEMKQIYSRAAEYCAMMGDGSSRCLESAAQQVPPSVYATEGLAEEVCAALGEWESRCLDLQYVIQ
jgi:hypothetical protein